MDRRTLGVVIAAFVAQGLALGSTIASFSLFVRPVALALDATTLEVSVGVSLMTLSLAACGVPVGQWLDRGSPRSVMFTGCAILSSAIALASQAQSLGSLAVLCVLAGIGIPMLGPLTTAAVVGKVASEQRGRALGIANLGLPVFGIAFALSAGFSIEAWGWRTTLQLFAMAIAVFGIPSIAFGIPNDLGENSRAQAANSNDSELWTPKRLLSSSTFRVMAVILGLGMGTTTGWVAHVAPFLNDLGASGRYAGGVLGAMQGAMMIGTLALGAMADRRSSSQILLGVFGLQALCFGLLFFNFPGATGVGLSIASVTLVVSGFASGGLSPVMSHLFAEKFGAANVGRSMGFANLAILPFGFGLPILAGGLRDVSGSYSGAIALCLGLVLVALGAIVALSRIERIERSEPSP